MFSEDFFTKRKGSALRHTLLALERPYRIDSETEVLHLVAAAWNLLVLAEMMESDVAVPNTDPNLYKYKNLIACAETEGLFDK